MPARRRVDGPTSPTSGALAASTTPSLRLLEFALPHLAEAATRAAAAVAASARGDGDG